MSKPTECSYALWTYYGRCFYRFTIPFLYSFKWRGRPPKLLTGEEQQEIQKNILHYQKIFEQKDKKAQRNEADKLHRRYRELYDEFNAVKTDIRARMEKMETELDKRLEEELDESYFDIETVEVFDKERVEVIK